MRPAYAPALRAAIQPAFGGAGAMGTYVPPSPTAPTNISPPVIAGGNTPGSVVSIIDHGVWGGIPYPSFTWQWKLNGTNISGATGLTYTVQPGDSGNLTVTGTATNGSGSASAGSNAITLASSYSPSADFSDSRNSMYAPINSFSG